MRTQPIADSYSLKPLVLCLRQEAGACRHQGTARLLEELAREVDRIGHYGEVVLPRGRTVLEEFLLLQDLVDFFETVILCPEELEAHRELLALINEWQTARFLFLQDLLDFIGTALLCPDERKAYRILLALRHQWHQWQTVETKGKVN
jgi:hypothetical protein